MNRKEGHLIEEIILFIIIILNIMDFFKVLSPWLDYVKKILSWAGLAYIVYHASPTKLLIGEKHNYLDFGLILSCFSLIVKNLVSFAGLARNKMVSNLGGLMSIVNFAPTHITHSAIKIPLESAVFNSLKLGIVNNPAELAAPFVTKITMFNPNVIFEFTNNGVSHFMALQPWGLNGVVLQFYNSLINNAAMINKVSFLIGIFGILIVSLYSAFTGRIKKNSVLGVLGAKEGPAINYPIKNFLMFLFAYTAFFIIIFNLVMEWLAIAVDAPLLMTGLLFYILFFIKYAARRRKKLANQKLGMDDFIEKINGFGFNFYYKFVNLFKKRSTILLALVGILVLHLLTDIANYLLPYVIGIRDVLYLGRFNTGHYALMHYLQLYPENTLLYFKMLIVYLMNVLGIFFMLSFPAYIWYKLLQAKEHKSTSNEELGYPKIKPFTTALIYFSLVISILIPAFSFSNIDASQTGIVGVDILTKEAISKFSFLNVDIILLIALIIALFVGIMNAKGYWHYTILPLILMSITSLGLYAYNFFMSSFKYYLGLSLSQISTNNFSSLLLGIWLFIFLIIELLFYGIAFFSSVYEIMKE